MVWTFGSNTGVSGWKLCPLLTYTPHTLTLSHPHSLTGGPVHEVMVGIGE